MILQLIFDIYHVIYKKYYFCFDRRKSPIKVILPPINVVYPTDSLKRNQAMIDAKMGSPIGVAATTVGET